MSRDDLATAVWKASLVSELLDDAQDALFTFRHPRARMHRAVRLLGSLTLPAGHRVEHAMREFSRAFDEGCPPWAAEQVTRIRSLMAHADAAEGWGTWAASLSSEELSELADAFFELYDLVCQAEG